MTNTQLWRKKRYGRLFVSLIRICAKHKSAMVVIKIKYRSRINLEKESGMIGPQILPRFDEVCKNKQNHTSHYWCIFFCCFINK